MNRVSAAGLGLIKRFEGFQAKVYRCPAGYQTIGYGHLIRQGENFTDVLAKESALSLLLRDIAMVEDSLSKLISVPLQANQYDALASFTFNLGGGALQRSTLRRKVNRQEHDEVPGEFMKWIMADGRKMRGLYLRRQAEVELWTSIIVI